jgi:hypothetical protein
MNYWVNDVRVLRKHWHCPAEGCHGEMKYVGDGITTIDSMSRHHCSTCNHEDWSRDTYPRIVFEDVDDAP